MKEGIMRGVCSSHGMPRLKSVSGGVTTVYLLQYALLSIGIKNSHVTGSSISPELAQNDKLPPKRLNSLQNRSCISKRLATHHIAGAWQRSRLRGTLDFYRYFAALGHLEVLHSVWGVRDGMRRAVRERQAQGGQDMDGTVDACIWYICTRIRCTG